MKTIYTIGYEGASVDQLIQTLLTLKIQVLADVRELPLSRKKGLSKNSLRERLEAVGIKYLHFKQLGDPKPGRDAAKSGNIARFEEIFYAHMEKPETKAATGDLLEVASKSATCMMCFERCAVHCHRSIIADEFAEAGFEVLNLVADKPEAYVSNEFEIPRHHSSKGLTAAE